MSDDFTKAQISDSQPGEFESQEDIMHDDVTADRDTNGISAGMERLGDLSGVQYDEEMDEVSVELHGEDGD